MATVQGQYIPEDGRSFVELASWAGDIGFASTPVAGDQVEGPSGLTINADGTVSGLNGTYTLRLIQSDGTVEAVSYEIAEALQPGQVQATYLPTDGLSYINLAAGFDNYIVQHWTTQPVPGDQFVFDPLDYALDTKLNLETEAQGVFDIWYINQSGEVYALTVDTTGLDPVVSDPKLFGPAFRSVFRSPFRNVIR